MPTTYGAASRRAALVLLGILAPASLVLTTIANRSAGVGLRQIAPGLAWLADAAVPSWLVALAIYFAIRPARPLAWPAPTTDWRQVGRTSTLWLAAWLTGLMVAALVLGRWVAYAQGAAPLAAFLVFAPLGEELLFRGAIFELAERALPRSPAAPLVISTVFFSLHHFQLHHFHPTGAALSQVAFTFPMGMAFGRLRRNSQSLWPGLGLHFLTNLPSAFGT